MDKYRSNNAALILLGNLPVNLIVIFILHLSATKLPYNLLKLFEGMFIRTILITCLLEGFDEVLLLVVPLVPNNLIDEDVFGVEVDIEVKHISQHELSLKFVLFAHLAVVYEARGIDNGLEHSVEEEHNRGQESLSMKGLWTPI